MTKKQIMQEFYQTGLLRQHKGATVILRSSPFKNTFSIVHAYFPWETKTPRKINLETTNTVKDILEQCLLLTVKVFMIVCLLS